jgi:protein TonB
VAGFYWSHTGPETQTKPSAFGGPDGAQQASVTTPSQPEIAAPLAGAAGEAVSSIPQKEGKPQRQPVRPFNAPAASRPPGEQPAIVPEAPPVLSAKLTPDPGTAPEIAFRAPLPPAAPPPAAREPDAGASPGKAPASVLVPATAISRKTPELPTIARQNGISGVVELQATVDKQGVVRQVKILSGSSVLAAAARSAVQEWRYRPATLNGQPVESEIVVRVAFEARR